MQNASLPPALLSLLKRKKDPIAQFLPAAQQYIRDIGGIILSRRHELCGSDKPEWLDEYEKYLGARGLTSDDAVRSHELWTEDLKSMGRFPVLSIETANIEAGEQSRRETIVSSSYVVRSGNGPSVCPNAAPQMPLDVLRVLVTQLRGNGVLKDDQTIHWVGNERGLGHICVCFLDRGPADERASSAVRMIRNDQDRSEDLVVKLPSLTPERRALADRVLDLLTGGSRPMTRTQISDRLVRAFPDEYGGHSCNKLKTSVSNILYWLLKDGWILSSGRPGPASQGYKAAPKSFEYRRQTNAL